jgi:adenylylsulfate kinase
MQHDPTRMRQEINKCSDHKGFVLWFSGLSGSGKSTLASAVEERLCQFGCKVSILDGDMVRQGLCSDLGFTDNDRKENIRRVGEVSKLLVDSGLVVLATFISPFADSRKKVRDLFSCGDYLEIYVYCPMDICEKRDVKGLYGKARQGNIKYFTGIESPYEPPVDPELTIYTDSQPLDLSVELVINLIKRRGLIVN